ncbi:tRNA (adenosine(37)-N6)-threonylcarbamoyltransferase complex dimerization subunit type 1 TsaB [Paenibacillus sp. GCM10027629]|uniref:tRNA (adenosine(37)-N6)-threonylcarbamoyltransferase complex dimerization subunit type 1 TsaB n=1 Tax=Paenibacillus sp. GCM10027629 TaxID=3273414 RepID=UPI00363F2DD7
MMSKEATRKRFLAIDTSTAMLSVAVVEGTRVLKEVSSSAERNHSLYLIPTVKEVLHALDLGEQDLDGIIIGRGPGSYTGVRIGVTVGKTLAWVWKKPIVGVSSLEGLALAGWQHGLHAEGAEASDGELEMRPLSSIDAQQDQHWIVPLMDARRGQVYTSLWCGEVAADSTPWANLEEDRVRLMKEWVNQLAEKAEVEGTPSSIWVVGDVELHRAEAERLGTLVRCPVQIVGHTIEARWLGLTGGKRLMQGEYDDAHRLEPNYTQLAEAEAKLLGKS